MAIPRNSGLHIAEIAEKIVSISPLLKEVNITRFPDFDLVMFSPSLEEYDVSNFRKIPLFHLLLNPSLQLPTPSHS